MVENSYDSHRYFLMWLIALGVIQFFVFLGFDKGYLAVAFENDQSHITKVIAGIFLFGSIGSIPSGNITNILSFLLFITYSFIL